MVRPLAPGAAIAVVAPAGPLPPTTYAEGLNILRARYTLRHQHPMDLAPDLAPNFGLPYLAASDEARATTFNAAMRDDEVEAVLCARGGYGSARILADLDAATLERRRVPLVGFSDITAIHAWAASFGVPTVHGPVVNQLSVLPQGDREALFALLEGEQTTTFEGLDCWHPGTAEGAIFGGNLAVLASLCGTPYLPRPQGKIFFFEEVNEPAYRLDRYLTQLLQAGALEGIVGVVIGDLQGCPAAETTLRKLLAPLSIPVVAQLPSGHGQRNRAFWLSTPAMLDGDTGSLQVDAPKRAPTSQTPKK
ncbi:MAG: LD-carboxypeptidase [Deltaproteobacteria bacterium]|nr:LD-carboxypeptidase [Deltaproteobacteria bacterium]